RLLRAADLEITKAVMRSQSNYFYTIVVTNLSQTPATNVVVVDTLPAGSTFDSATPAPNGVSGDDYTFNLGLIPAGGSVPVTLSMIYTAMTPALITNRAVVSTITVENNLSNNTAFAVAPTVSTNVDLVLSKTVSPAGMAVGDSNLTYTLTVMNISTVFAGTITVTDALPLSVEFLSASIAPFQTNGNQYAFNIDFFGASASTTIVINAAYTGSVPTVITNWANVVGTNTELVLANNADFAVVTVTNSGLPCVPGVDTDGDGMTDCEEICAGTDPLDPGDFLWVQISRVVTAMANHLTFPTEYARTYRVETSTNLLSNGWTTAISNLPGIGTLRSVMHTSPVERIYYRVRVDSP
ncbi:MAG: hypothetical protein AAF492_22960, partial [Verrucomicrobiota bacterium]